MADHPAPIVSTEGLDSLAHDPDEWASFTNRFAGHAIASMRAAGIPDDQIGHAITEFYGRTAHLDTIIDQWRFAVRAD